MLKSITMRNVATYDNVGVTFDDLNKVNLIYGPNGTGKTTISNYLKHYSKNRIVGEAIPPQFSGCQVQWDRDASPEVIVYNRAFKKENIGKTTIPGVFVMGKSAVDNSKRIQEIQDELRTIRTESEDLTSSQQIVKESYLYGGSIYQTLLAHIDSNISKEANSLYSKVLDGLKRDNNKRIDKILEVFHRIGSVTVLSEADIRKTIGIVNTKDVDPLSTINLPNLAPLKSIEKEDIWNKVIIGSGDVDFAGFINSLGISDWVRQGIGKMDKTKGVCPFCQQHTISSDLIEKFNNYFNDEYNTRDKLTFTNDVATDTIHAISETVEEKVASLTDKLLEIFRDLKADKEEFKKLGITFEEKAFYDILVDLRDKHKFEYADERCIALAHKIKELIDGTSLYADWINNDNLKSQLASDLTMLIYKEGYPPEWDEEVFNRVLEQVENYKRFN